MFQHVSIIIAVITAVYGLSVPDLPSYGEPCTDKCQSGYVCTKKTCQCKANFYYDKDTSSCIDVCVDATGACESHTGFHPACNPDCQNGAYYICSSGHLHRRECELKTYIGLDSQRLTTFGVYNPTTKLCGASASYCPRLTDDYETEN